MNSFGDILGVARLVVQHAPSLLAGVVGGVVSIPKGGVLRTELLVIATRFARVARKRGYLLAVRAPSDFGRLYGVRAQRERFRPRANLSERRARSKMQHLR